MNISRRMRFAAATTTVLTGVLTTGAVFAAQAQAMPEVTTLSYNGHGYTAIQSWPCAVNTHFGITNPITAVANGCSTQVYLANAAQHFCVSPLTLVGNFNARFNVTQVIVTNSRANC